MKKLFSNTLLGIKKKPLQLIGVVLLITISTMAYIAMNFGAVSLERGYNSLVEQSVQQHYQMSIRPDTSKLTKEETEDVMAIVGITMNNTFFVNGQLYQYSVLFEEATEKQIKSAGFSDLNDSIAKRQKNSRTVNNELYELYTTKFINRNDVINERYYSATYQKDGKTYVLISITNEINKPYMQGGSLPTKDSEVLIFKNFGELNNIGIGNSLAIANSEFTVSGYALHGRYAYPLLDMMNFFPDKQNETIVFMSEDSLYDFAHANNLDFTVGIQSRFKDGIDNESLATELVKEYEGYGRLTHNSQIMTISSVIAEIDQNKLIAFWFSIVILSLAVVVIAFIVKKRLDNDSLTVGVLRSLGYSNAEISTSYMAYPIISSIAGGLLGYLAGMLMSVFFFVPQYRGVYVFDIKTVFFDLNTILMGTLIPLLVINVVAFIVIMMILDKRVIDILKPGAKMDTALTFPTIKSRSILKMIIRTVLYPLILISFMFKLIGVVIKRVALFLAKPFGFITRFKISLAFRSMGRLLTLCLTLFISGMFMTTATIGTGLMKDLKDTMMSGLNYERIAIYRGVALDMEAPEDFVNGLNANGCHEFMGAEILCYDAATGIVTAKTPDAEFVVAIFDKITSEDLVVTQAAGVKMIGHNGKELSEDDIKTVSFTALDYNANIGKEDKDKIIKLNDEKGNDVTELIKDGFVISEFVRKAYKVNVGDELTLTMNGREITQKVLAVHQEFNGPTIYYDKTLTNSIVYESFNAPEMLFLLSQMGLTFDELSSNAYSIMYTKRAVDVNSKKYMIVVDFKQFEKSIDKGFDMMDLSINILIGVTSLISIIVVTIMTNFTIEDNFKNISVLKVMGYDDKRINKMVLRVYAPFIILAIIIAVPVTVFLLDFGLGLLTESIGMAIPVRINMMKAMSTVIALVVVYFVSMFISKRTLKRITLQEALKAD